MANKKSNKKGTPCIVTETPNLTFQEFPAIGKTICTLYSDPYAFSSLAEKLVEDETDITLDEMTKLYPPYQLHSTYTGVSKVNENEGDMYDPQVGRDIAKSKAIDKFQRAMKGNLRYLLAELNRAVASVEHYMDIHGINYDDVINVHHVKATKYRDAYPDKRG